MEQKIGRLLSKEEIVHHKDGNKLNNDVDNLEIINRIKHISLHSSIKTAPRKEIICDYCGKTFYILKSEYDRKVSNNQKYFFCSRKCIGKFGFNKKKIL